MRSYGALLLFCLGATRALAAADAGALRIDLDPPSALGSDAGGLEFLSGRALLRPAHVARRDRGRRQIRVDREAVATSDDLVGVNSEALLLRGRLLRTLHEGQIAASSQVRAHDLRVAPEAKSPDSARAAAAPVD